MQQCGNASVFELTKMLPKAKHLVMQSMRLGKNNLCFEDTMLGKLRVPLRKAIGGYRTSKEAHAQAATKVMVTKQPCANGPLNPKP